MKYFMVVLTLYSSLSLLNNNLFHCRATSSINGVTYLPWSASDLVELRKVSPLAQDFDDPDGLIRLSDQQRKHFHGWLRPFDISDSPKMIHIISSLSIKQVSKDESQ